MATQVSRASIHPSAIVHPDADLAADVEVGPYSVVSEHVRIGRGTRVGSHCVIEGRTVIGQDNEIFTGAVVGSVTQDKKYDGGESYLLIGDRNKIREYVTINPGTKAGTETVIGNDNLIMAYAHVAHDCIVKDRAVLANAATLAGHVVVEDGAIIGGLSGVHQFVRVGSLAIVGGCSKLVQDGPPFIMVDGHPARSYGLNTVGLERNGIDAGARMVLKRAFKIIFRSGLSLPTAIQRIESEVTDHEVVRQLLAFLKASHRGICK